MQSTVFFPKAVLYRKGKVITRGKVCNLETFPILWRNNPLAVVSSRKHPRKDLKILLPEEADNISCIRVCKHIHFFCKNISHLLCTVTEEFFFHEMWCLQDAYTLSSKHLLSRSVCLQLWVYVHNMWFSSKLTGYILQQIYLRIK